MATKHWQGGGLALALQFYFKVSIFLLCCSSLLTGAEVGKTDKVAPVASTSKLTLKDAKSFAVRHNYDVKALEKRIQSFKATSQSLRSTFYPHFGIAGGFENESTDGKGESASLTYVFGNINLFNGFRDVYSIDLNDAEIQTLAIKFARKKFEVELSVEQAFHEYLYVSDLIRLKDEELKINRKHQKLVNQMLKVGEASHTDVKEFDIKESVLSSELVDLLYKKESARIDLRKYLGDDVGAKIEPVGVLQHLIVEGKLQDYVKLVTESGYDVKLSKIEYERSVTNLKSIRADWMPKVDFEVQAGLLPLESRSEAQAKDENSVGYVFLAKIDLFSGLDSYWRRKSLVYEKEFRSLALKSSILNSLSDLEKSFRRLKSIEKSVALEKGNTKKIEKYYESVFKEYKRGYKNSADLNSASDWFFSTKAKQLNYKFEFLKEKIALEKQLGTYLNVKIISHG